MDIPTGLFTAFDGDDDLGVVIRSQIFVEQYLNFLITKLLVSPSHFKKMKLDYDKTVKFAIALGLDPKFEAALSNLGSLRNTFAHNIKPSITAADSNNLYKCLSKDEKAMLQESVKKIGKQFEEEASDYKSSSPKRKFIYIVTILIAALHTACRQAA